MTTPPSVVRRVDVLETKMSGLEQELREFRTEVAAEFTNVRAAMAAGFAELRTGLGETNRQMHAYYTELRTGLDATNRQMHALRDEFKAGLDDTNRQMRVLHEDVISRIALLQEAIVPKRRPRRRPK